MLLMFLQVLSIVCLIGINLFVLTQKHDRTAIVSFTVFCISLAFWIGFGLLSNIATPEALLINRMVFVFPLAALLAAHVFIIDLIQPKKRDTITHVCLGIACAAVAAIISGTGVIVQAVIPQYDTFGQLLRYDIDYSGLHFWYLGLIIISAIAIMANLILQMCKQHGARKKQLEIMAGGFLLTVVSGLILAGVIPSLTGSSDTSQYVFVVGFFSVISFAYVVVRHSLFDIRTAAVRTLAYVLSLGALAAIYFTVAYVVSQIFFTNTISGGLNVSTLNVLFALGLAFLFQPIRTTFDTITDRVFFHNRYNASAFYAKVSETLAATTDLRTMLERTSVVIADDLRSEQVFFYIQYGNDQYLSAGTTGHKKFLSQDVEDIERGLNIHKEVPVFVDMLEKKSDFRRALARRHVSVLSPLAHQGINLGYVALGDRRTGTYTSRDAVALRTIADELVIAIQNSLSVLEVKLVNEQLEQRIADATAELRTSNARLKRLDTSKDEFLSMASHQLRTPLTSIKGFISMVLEEDAGKITDAQRHLLDQAYSSSERMVHLISDFLNVSRLQTGKFVIDPRPTNLANVVSQEVEIMSRLATSHGIVITSSVAKQLPKLQLDEDKVRQVVMNFIDNAIFYSRPQSTIVVKLYKQQKHVVFEVHDHGIGVPKNVQPKLFEKFFRADNAKKQRPDGTGIGLFIAKKVITESGGEIIFESTQGKGSVFGFRMPIDTLKVEYNLHERSNMTKEIFYNHG